MRRAVVAAQGTNRPVERAASNPSEADIRHSAYSQPGIRRNIDKSMNEPTDTLAGGGLSSKVGDANLSALNMSEESGKGVQVKQVNVAPTTGTTNGDSVINDQSPIHGNEARSGDTTRSVSDNAGFDFTHLKAGDRDPWMDVIIKEILFKNEDSLVYVDEDYTLQWYWSDLQPQSASIFKRAAELEARSQFLRLRKTELDLLSALRLIGEGVAELLSTKDNSYADAALDTAEKFVSQRSREVSRGWYFGPLLGLFLISLVALLLLDAWDPGLTKATVLACTIAGGMGAFISRALASDSVPIAATAGRTLHLIEAIMRWCIGLTAGLAVWFLVRGNIAGSFLNGGDIEKMNTFALVVIALLAGASERLLPSLIETFDNSIVKKQKTSTAGDGK